MTSARELYEEGYSTGIEWALHDRADHITSAEGTAEIMEEIHSSHHRPTRIYYLGALRGYRSVALSLLGGRWGT